MKKIISVLLSALMVGSAVTSLPLSAGAASVEQGAVDTVGTPIVSDGFHIVWNGGNSSKIIKYTGNAVNVFKQRKHRIFSAFSLYEKAVRSLAALGHGARGLLGNDPAFIDNNYLIRYCLYL